MGMLSGIKYIFQIPFEWFRSVDAVVFGDHQGPGIKFVKSGDGSRAISVDYDELDARYGASGSYFTGTKKTLTGVVWTGTQIVISSENRTYNNGLLTSVTANADEKINTVTYNP